MHTKLNLINVNKKDVFSETGLLHIRLSVDILVEHAHVFISVQRCQIPFLIPIHASQLLLTLPNK